MKHSLYLKFILTYVVFGFLSFFVIATFSSQMTLNHLTAQRAENLYKEANYISTNFVRSYYSQSQDADSLRSIHSQFQALDIYLGASIWLLNSDGTILVDSDVSFTENPSPVISAFDPTDMGNRYYIVGNFYDTFDEEVLSVAAPITYNFRTRGYVLIHTPLSSIEGERDQLLNITYLTVLLVFLLSLLVLAVFTFTVYRPLMKITEAARQYAQGNFKYALEIYEEDEIGQLADKISAVFVPVVVVIALVSAAIWYFFGPAPQIVYTLVIATTVLIIACPCALGLATPMSIISGVGRAAEFGVLVRDADALQRASTLDTVVFDKTGTLTEGKPQVVAVKTFADVDEAQALRLAAALEQGSSHPLARAILDKAGDMQLPQVNGFRTLRGLGVSGEAEGHALLLGNQALLNDQQVDTKAIEADISAEASQGATPVLLAIDGKAVALLAVRDPLRSDSVAALQRLHKAGYRLVMLTGDNPTTANAIAKEAGIDEVIAGVLPDGKAEAIKHLQSEGRQVAMVGDGINDAPALAQADVGIAMGGGSDVAIETAAITLMRHSLMGVADALAISRATLRNMKQNLLGAFIYNSIGIPVAAGILWPFTGTLLNPVVAGAAMALSSITVVSNANRLLRFKPKE